MNYGNETKKFGIVSLVFGIVGLLSSCIIIGGVFSVIGIVFCILSKNANENSKAAMAGMVCSIIGVVLSVFILFLAVLGTFVGESENTVKQEETAIESTTNTEEPKEIIESQETKNDVSSEGNKVEETVEEQTAKETVEESKDEDFPDGLEEFKSGNYLYITNGDLDKYAPNLSGVKIYTVISINDIKDNKIQSTLTDGFMMSSFDVGSKYDTYKKLFKRDDTVAILGTVSGYTDYKITNKSVSVENCLVFAAGDKAEEYNQTQSDEGLSEYFVVTGEVADTNSDISEEEYKNLCEQLNYEDILRNPSSNKNKYCVISGKVDQIIEGWFGSYTIYIADSDGNKWECFYSYKDGESHLLEGDNVTVYGKCNGTTTSTTVMGKQVTLPDIRLQYIK